MGKTEPQMGMFSRPGQMPMQDPADWGTPTHNCLGAVVWDPSLLCKAAKIIAKAPCEVRLGSRSGAAILDMEDVFEQGHA